MALVGLGLVTLAVFLGALAQRLTGIGFTLVAAPILATIIGPLNGVTLCLILNTALSCVVFATTWRHVMWSRVTILSGGCLAGTAAGVLLVAALPRSALLMTVGLVTLLAVATALTTTPPRILQGRRGSLISGVVSGSMNVSAGTGGPILAVHSIADKWTPIAFVATAQVYFIGANTMALGMREPAYLQPETWIAAFLAMATGAVTGHYLARVVKQKTAFRLVIGFSLTGGTAVFLRGLWSLAEKM